MQHNLRETAINVDIVSVLKHNSLMSVIKFVDASYITVLTPEEVLIYGGNEVKLRESGQAILTVRRCKTSGPWRVPLKPKVEK